MINTLQLGIIFLKSRLNALDQTILILLNVHFVSIAIAGVRSINCLVWSTRGVSSGIFYMFPDMLRLHLDDEMRTFLIRLLGNASLVETNHVVTGFLIAD